MDEDDRDATDELLESHGGALEFVSNLSVFNACMNGDKTRMLITDGCDAVFTVKLRKNHVARLIAELQALHDQMHEQPQLENAG